MQRQTFSFALSLALVLQPMNLFAADSSTSTAENRPGVATAANATEVLASLSSDDPKLSAFQAAIQTCKSQVTSADSACAASQNSNAQTASSNLTSYTSSTTESSDTTSSSIASSCSGFAGLMSGLQPLMTAYNSQCETARKQCPSSCNSQVKTAASGCDGITGTDTTSQNQKAACLANAKKAESYAKSVSTSCASYKQNSTQALAVFAAAAAAVASMLACQQDTAATETSEDAAQCTFTSDPTECTRADTSSLNQSVTKTADDSTLSDTPSGVDGDSPFGRSQSGASGASLPQSRGAGVNANSGPVAEKTADAPTGATMQADVIDGDIGGGSRGRGVASSGGYPDAENESLSRALKNADLRMSGLASQFTSSNGRSNWQKVRERYRDNSPTLNVVAK